MEEEGKGAGEGADGALQRGVWEGACEEGGGEQELLCYGVPEWTHSQVE